MHEWIWLKCYTLAIYSGLEYQSRKKPQLKVRVITSVVRVLFLPYTSGLRVWKEKSSFRYSAGHVIGNTRCIAHGYIYEIPYIFANGICAISSGGGVVVLKDYDNHVIPAG